MAKAKVTHIRPTEQPADTARTVPLSAVSITWPRRNDFEGDDARAPVVLTGKHVAQAPRLAGPDARARSGADR